MHGLWLRLPMKSALTALTLVPWKVPRRALPSLLPVVVSSLLAPVLMMLRVRTWLRTHLLGIVRCLTLVPLSRCMRWVATCPLVLMTILPLMCRLKPKALLCSCLGTRASLVLLLCLSANLPTLKKAPSTRLPAKLSVCSRTAIGSPWCWLTWANR